MILSSYLIGVFITLEQTMEYLGRIHIMVEDRVAKSYSTYQSGIKYKHFKAKLR